MSFEVMEAAKYPRRLWAAYGPAAVGKSRFAAQMRTPALIVDADGRFTEQLDFAAGTIYRMGKDHSLNVDPDAIARKLREELPGSGVLTVVIDSLTAILRPIINEALADIEAGRAKNKVAAFKDKALAMSLLQDAVSVSGADTLWIWHTHESRDAGAKLVEKASIPEVELVRLRRSLNVILRMDVEEDGRRSIKVDWARNGNSGIKLYDDTGSWIGMPEKLEEAIYSDGIKPETAPPIFSGPEEAIAWAFEQGCFRDAVHAKNAYEECKRVKAPKTAAAMAVVWKAEVDSRVKAQQAQKEAA